MNRVRFAIFQPDQKTFCSRHDLTKSALDSSKLCSIILLKVGANMTNLEAFIRFVESLTTEQADFILEHLHLSTPSSGSEVPLDEEAVQPLLQEVS